MSSPIYLDWSNPHSSFLTVCEHFRNNGFSTDPASFPKSIHDHKAITFYEFLGADQYVLEILNNKLKPPASVPLFPYHEKNNASALSNLTPLRKKIDSWLSENYITEVSTKPLFVNPLTVKMEPVVNSTKLKCRPCIDLSRCLNNFVTQESS